MVEKRIRNRDVRWRNVGDTIARNRVARWVIRRANIPKAPRRPRKPVPGWVTWSMAWGVHLYTAMGAICAAMMVVLLVRGGANAFRGTFALMLVATIIDATDGTLARRVRVKDVLPGFDGRRLDDLVDWLTYTCVPLLLLWRAEVLPAGQSAWLLVPLLASAYGFCQASIKTDGRVFPRLPVPLERGRLLPLPAGPPRLGLSGRDPASLGSDVRPEPLPLPLVPPRPDQHDQQPRRGRLGDPPLVDRPGPSPATACPGHRVADPFTRGLVLASAFYPAWYLVASWAITVRNWSGRRARLVRVGD